MPSLHTDDYYNEALNRSKNVALRVKYRPRFMTEAKRIRASYNIPSNGFKSGKRILAWRKMLEAANRLREFNHEVKTLCNQHKLELNRWAFQIETYILTDYLEAPIGPHINKHVDLQSGAVQIHASLPDYPNNRDMKRLEKMLEEHSKDNKPFMRKTVRSADELKLQQGLFLYELRSNGVETDTIRELYDKEFGEQIIPIEIDDKIREYKRLIN